jgi:hypothetical protein
MRVSWLAARRASCLQTPLNEFLFYHQAWFSSFERGKRLETMHECSLRHNNQASFLPMAGGTQRYEFCFGDCL